MIPLIILVIYTKGEMSVRNIQFQMKVVSIIFQSQHDVRENFVADDRPPYTISRLQMDNGQTGRRENARYLPCI